MRFSFFAAVPLQASGKLIGAILVDNIFSEQVVSEEDAARQESIIHSDFFARASSGVSFYKESVAQCFECMRVCPIGRQERKLK